MHLRARSQHARKLSAACAAAVTGALVVAPSALANNLGSAGGFTYVKGSATVSEVDFTLASPTAQCPDGMIATGGGASLDSDPRFSFIGDTYPGNTGWQADVWNYNTRKTSKATAWAVCVPNSGTLTYISAISSLSNSPATAEFAYCPGGSTITGGGVYEDDPLVWHPRASATNTGGEWLIENIHLVDESDNYAVFAACWSEGGTPSYKRKQVTGRGVLTAKAYCPKGKSVTGGGFIGEGNSLAGAAVSKPIDSKKDADKVPDDGWMAVVNNGGNKKKYAMAQVACR